MTAPAERGYLDAKNKGILTYIKTKPCMLCGGTEYWIRNHRCITCNPHHGDKRKANRDEVIRKDHYTKEGPSIAGKYVPMKKAEWPVCAFEDADTQDHVGIYHAKHHIAQRYASSAATTADN